MAPSRIECEVNGEVVSSIESEDKITGVLDTPVGTAMAVSGRYKPLLSRVFGEWAMLAAKFPGDDRLISYEPGKSIQKKQSYQKDGKNIDITITAK